MAIGILIFKNLLGLQVMPVFCMRVERMVTAVVQPGGQGWTGMDGGRLDLLIFPRTV